MEFEIGPSSQTNITVTKPYQTCCLLQGTLDQQAILYSPTDFEIVSLTGKPVKQTSGVSELLSLKPPFKVSFLN